MAAPSLYFVDPVGGDDAGGAGTIGDPWKTVQFAMDNITRDATDGDLVNVKAGGTDTLSAALDFSTYGTPSGTAPFGLRGYTSAQGDGGIGVISGGGSVGIITTARNGLQIIDMHLHNTGAEQICLGGQESRFINSEFDNSSYALGFGNISQSSNSVMIDCYVHNIADNIGTGPGCLYLHSVFANDGRNPTFFVIGTVGANFYGCIWDLAGATEGVRLVDSQAVINCVFYGGGGTGKGIRHSAARDGSVILNNIFEGFSGAGGVGVDLQTGSIVSAFSHNAFFDNATNFNNTFTEFFGSDNESLSASPFTDAAGGDFSTPDSQGNVRASDGGAYPSDFPVGATTLDLNKGASQDAGAAAAAGSVVGGKYKGLVPGGGLGTSA